MSASAVATVTDHEAFAAWAVERFPERCSLTVELPMHLVDRNTVQQIIDRLRMVATRFNVEVDPALLDELVASGEWRDGDFYARAPLNGGKPVPGVRMELDVAVAT